MLKVRDDGTTIVRTRLMKSDGERTWAKCPRCRRFVVVPGLRLDEAMAMASHGEAKARGSGRTRP